MEVLRIKIEGLSLFEEAFDLNLTTEQNVTDQNGTSVRQILNRIYSNNVIALIGKNASGKTMTLLLIMFVLDVFLGNTPVNHSTCRSALIGREFRFELYVFNESDKKLYKVVSLLKMNQEGELFFEDETIYSKPRNSKMRKSTIFDFNYVNSVTFKRPENSLLPSDNTYFRIVTKQEGNHVRPFFDFCEPKNETIQMSFSTSQTAEQQSVILAYLDPNVEFVRQVSNGRKNFTVVLYEVKFKNSKSVHLVHPGEILKFISSGTMKGIQLFNEVFLCLSSGGYMMVDDIESHFNLAIVQTVIGIFSDPEINKRGATLIFTTHDAQLLDEFERDDSVYVSLRKNELMSLTRLNRQKYRGTVKRNYLYESDVLNGTAPNYLAYMNLRKLAQKVAGER